MSKRKKAKEVITDPAESANAAGLRYVFDAQPGFHRRRRGTGFSYVDAEGKPVRDKDTLARIKSLVIPPAWSNVWICPNPKGHLQVTGRDARGRKQSRYHPRWHEVRDETKYERMTIFGAALPAIRERVEHDLSLPGMPRPKILAAIVRLMEVTLIRVGNEEYARENQSYGLTTMRNKHVEVEGSSVTFKFQGKSKVRHTVDISDRRLARIIQRCQDIPGYELFQYIDSEGNHHTVDSADVNDYMREMTNEDFTAKDFRTWAGSLHALQAFKQIGEATCDADCKRNIVAVLDAVSKKLGNSRTVCKKYYVHPGLIRLYEASELEQGVQHVAGEDEATIEKLLLRLLSKL